MKLSYLEYFLDVVKFGSITKAAEAHYLKQGNLSRYIKYIEDDFNATLFVRSSKGVELTPEGEQVYLWAKETLDTQDALRKSFSEKLVASHHESEKIELLLLPSINSNLYSSIIPPFLQKEPQVQLNSYEEDLCSIIDLVEKTSCSIGITILDEKRLEYVASRANLMNFILNERNKFVVYFDQNSNLIKDNKSISLKMLETLPILIYAPSKERISPIIEILSEYVNLKNIQTVTNLILFHSLLHTGQYISIAIDSSYEMEEYSKVIIRDKIVFSTCIIVSKESFTVPVIKRFIEFCCNQEKVVSHIR